MVRQLFYVSVDAEPGGYRGDRWWNRSNSPCKKKARQQRSARPCMGKTMSAIGVHVPAQSNLGATVATGTTETRKMATPECEQAPWNSRHSQTKHAGVAVSSGLVDAAVVGIPRPTEGSCSHFQHDLESMDYSTQVSVGGPVPVGMRGHGERPN